jgi:PAS domain S-box-containing protein
VAFQNSSLKRKLVGTSFETSILVLVLTCVVLFYYEIHNYRQASARNLSNMADIIAANSSAILTFDDQNLAQQILSGLRVEPEITAAAFFDDNGKLFAKYPAARPVSAFPASPEPDGIETQGAQLTLFKPVMQEQNRVGTLFLQENLNLTSHLKVYSLVLFLVHAGSGMVALFLSNFFQRQISEPLLNLANVAKTVSRRKDYSVRATKTSGDEVGDLTEAFNSMLDQIQASHAALTGSEERFVRFMRHLPGLAWIKSRDGRYVYANDAAQNIFGKNAEQLYGKTDQEIFPPETAEQFQRNDERALASETGVQAVESLRHADGEVHYSLVNKFPIRGAGGEATHIGGMAIDITERINAETNLERAHEEALAASRAKDDFLAALSHELRTPLNPVLLVASDAANDLELPAGMRANFEMIRRNVELEARLIDDLLDLTRIERGKLLLDWHLLDAHDVLQEAIATVRMDMEKKQIKLLPVLQAGDHVVLGDTVRMQQVFWNVLKNAVKFTPEGGKITVETAAKDGRLIVKITDTGIGMDSEELNRIFVAFSQGDHARDDAHRFGGLGLGLTISRVLVELHAGSIRATSEGKGKGATFLIDLPLAQISKKEAAMYSAKRPARTSPAQSPGTAAPLRILLVEDHEPTREALTHLLARRRYEVTATASASDARAAAAKNNFDVLISDIGLPDGNGYDLMKEFRDRYGLKGIALTGYGTEQNIARGENSGFAAYLIKPVRMESLDNALAAVLGGEADSVP